MASKVDSSGLSVISEERSARKHHEGSDDYGSVYTHKTRSSYGISKKKLHPLMLGPSRTHTGRLVSLHSASKNNLSEFTQRIMSAKLLRVKQVQNQLNETQIQLNELINENRTLKNLQKRQEGALRRYEGNHAELPQLIRSHNEEIRTLKANNKIIKAQLKESNAKLKDRETELESLRDSYAKLKKLSSEKNLLEREKLQRKVEELQEVVKEQESKIQVLSRKILLESKNYRHHLNIEILKHKETQKDLNSALTVISKLEIQLAKEKPLPGNKVLMKRDTKGLMSVITNKSTEIQSKVGVIEDSFLSSDEGKRKSQSSDSPESELELLNGIGSSDITPSPTQDIFPDINRSKKSSPEIEIKTEITPSKSELIHETNYETRERHNGTPKPRKTNLIKKISRFSFNVEENAKVVAEKLNEDMEEIENLAQKVDSSFSITAKKPLRPISAFETKSISFEMDTEKNNQLSDNEDEKESDEDADDSNALDVKREVPKRKLDDDRESGQETLPPDFDLESELTESQQQKLENMTKTWNNIKSKIQEERKKAEDKMKTLKKMKDRQISSVLSDVESEKGEEAESQSDDELNTETKKELRFVNFTDDAYILKELEKTDKIFNKLKNEKQKIAQKSPLLERKSKTNITPKSKPKQQAEIKSFRTESQRNPKYLEDFQNEYQKQNLLKALKAIDVGKDPNLPSEESEESETELKKEKFSKKNGLKRIQKFSSGKSNKDLMTELFGSQHKIGDNVKLELGATLNE